MQRPGSHIRNPRRDKVSTPVSSWLNFVPTAVNNLYLWFDASDISTITESSGAVSQWNDKSGNAFNVSQATGTAQPTTGLSTQNGLNVIRFVTNDQMTYDAGSDAMLFSEMTFFVIANITSSSQFQRLFSLKGTAATPDYVQPNTTIVQGQNLQRIVTFNSTNTGDLTPASSTNLFVLNNFFVADGLVGSPNVTASLDYSVDGIKTFNSFANKRYLRIGAEITSANAAASFLNGNIGEILIYNRLLTLVERRAIRSYLKTKWNIPSVLQVGQP
jgi:hypothetical protein